MLRIRELSNLDPMFSGRIDLLDCIIDKYKDAKRMSHDGFRCVYHHRSNGIGCAIGCLFTPDEAESIPNMDVANLVLGSSASSLIERLLPGGNTEENVGFLLCVQSLHDKIASERTGKSDEERVALFLSLLVRMKYEIRANIFYVGNPYKAGGYIL